MSDEQPDRAELQEFLDAAGARLTGAVARLRAVTDADAARLAGWDQEPSVGVLHTARLALRSETEIRKQFLRWASGVHPWLAAFSIERVHDTELVGIVMFKYVGPGRTSLHVTMRADAVGAGLGTDAVRLAIDHAFGDLATHRLELQTLAVNTRAIAAFEKAGFQVEARLRHAHRIANRWHDEIVMSVVADD